MDKEELELLLEKVEDMLRSAWGEECAVWDDEDDERPDADFHIQEALGSVYEALKWLRNN